MTELGLTLGQPGVLIANGRGMTPEEIADMALARIIYVGPEVPEPARAQALAYRDRIRMLLIEYLHAMEANAVAQAVMVLHKAGYDNAATLLSTQYMGATN